MKINYDHEHHKILEFQIRQNKQMISYLDSLVQKLNIAMIFTILLASCFFFIPNLKPSFNIGTYFLVSVAAVFVVLIYMYVFSVYTRSKLEIQLKSKEDEFLS